MLNHSCIRCRSKKLKCNGEVPCSNCQKKSLQDECRHITRKARPRKLDTSTASKVQTSFGSASPSNVFSGNVTTFPAYGSPSNVSYPQTLLMLAREALGDPLVCADLIRQNFYWKVQSLIHASIDLRKVLKHIDLIFDRNSPFVDPDDIVLCMMTVALSLQYLPKTDTPLNLIERLISIDGSLGPRLRQKLLFELSSNFIRHQMNHGQHSYTHVQCLTLLLVYDQHGEGMKEQISEHAIRASQQLGLHCIETNDGTTINELMTRTWWFLVTRNWFSSLSTSVYSIQPQDFSTRLPVENAYLDMTPYHQEGPAPALSETFFASRYSFALIKLSDMIRQLVDYRQTGQPDLAQVVQQHFEDFEEQLPQVYSLATSDAVDGSNLQVNYYSRRCKLERWMLHQLLFHAYLELHQFETSKPIPEACISLAYHMIDIQGKVSKSCFVLDSLHVNVSNVIKAASVLVVDLIQVKATSSIVRSIRLRKIWEALRKCEAQGLTKQEDFDQVKDMLDLEEKLWRQSRPGSHSVHSSPSFDLRRTNSKSQSTSPVESLPTPEGSEVTMFSFLPSDAGLYPIFQADTNNAEWSRLYESFLDLSNVK